MSEQTARLVDRLQERLRTVVRRITLADLAYGFVVTLAAVAAVWLVSVALEAVLWLDPTPRAVLLGAALVLVGGLVAYFLGRPLLRLAGVLPRLSDEDAARRIGQRYPAVSDRLLNLLQLARGRRSASSDAMVDRAVQSLAGDVQPVPFEEVEDFRRVRRTAPLASLPVVGLLLFLLVAPGTFSGASQRLLAPGTFFQKPAPFALAVEPGDVQLVRGDSLAITVRATGEEIPPTLTLAVQPDGETAVDEIKLAASTDGVFRHVVPNVRQALRYRAQAGRVETAWHTAAVTARPMVRRLQVTLTPPSYAGLPARTLDPNVGDVTALPGTQVALDVQLGGPQATEALVQFDDGAADTLAIEGDAATGSFTLRRDGSYRIALRSAAGTASNEPITYHLETTSDAPPQISFLAPEADGILGEDLRTQLQMRLSDDFGFARLRLYYRLAESRFGEPTDDFKHLDLPISDPRMLSQEVLHDWLLTRGTDLDPVPGDVIEYYARVWDNNRVAGYQTDRTDTQRLRLRSLAEKYERLDEQQDAVQEQMEETLREEEAAREQFEQLRDELRRQPEGDWEDSRQAEQLQERQQQLEESVEQMGRQLEEVTEQMQEESLSSPETQQMYEELQEVAKEINSPELQEALKKLQEAMQNLDRQQMQQAMENFEFSEEQYRERLERALDLFKQLRVQQELEEAARRAEALAEQQKRLAEETERLQEKRGGEQQDGEPSENEQDGEQQENQDGQKQDGEQQDGQKSDSQNSESEGQESKNQDASESADEESADDKARREQLAEEQQQASEEMKELEKQVEKLREQMKDTKQSPQQEMQKLSEEMKQQQMPQQMQQNSQQLQQQQMQKAKQGQQQMQQSLEQMKKKLQMMQQGMQGQQQQMNMAALRQALTDVLTLSERQEGLRRSVRGLSSESPALRDYAQQQSTLATNLGTVSDSLQALARRVPKMTRAVQKETGEALREMEDATEAMTERTADRAAGQQKASMMHLNELALLLSDVLDQMQNQQGQPGGMSSQQMAQQMQQMAGQQQQLNQQIQQMLNDAQGQRLSGSQQQRLQQMAEQQKAIQKQLEQLRKQGGDEKMLGDLGKIAEEMGRSIEELQQRRVSRPTVERQRRILTRMLDAQRSLQNRNDKRKRREGQKAGDDYRERPDGETTRSRPADLPPQEEAERLRRDLIRALENGYAPDYEELIKRYFELLQNATPQDGDS